MCGWQHPRAGADARLSRLPASKPLAPSTCLAPPWSSTSPFPRAQPPKSIDVALLRGTTADLAGNVSFEREALYLDQLLQAMAARNSGGLVVVQVERVVERHSLPSRAVHLHASLVDLVGWDLTKLELLRVQGPSKIPGNSCQQ